MSDYTTRAVAQIEVNGNAGPELAKLKQRADDFRDAIARAYKEGNDKLAKKLTRELKSTEKEIRNIQSQTANVEMTLRRLDKASPKELRQTLKQMEKDLQKIERGSAAWNTQTRRIKLVKAELDKVNAELKIGEGRWSKFNRILNDWQMTIAGAAAAVTGLVMAGKAAVQVYADLDAEMASVRKFTGMTADEVVQLNEAFKQIDTRTSREDLNKLAQEAGRLGLSSQQDVLGFVRAADKINVALDDLGEGATLTLSKLTDIFGDKERLGVEQSLLSVGSVINELSQNCTASAPYIAEFASRMGGVGKQADMTIQQIMGLAAVLDANQQKLEASATAVSQVLVRLYREPAKYAKVAGLEVKAFSDLLKKDANAAFLQFLEALSKAGGMDVLSPMFKEMGENGSRAITALSTLASNIDKVRWEQGEANKAFSEAISIDKEFNVQNNTVQAQLDKARKGFTEMAAALGEKLMPVMRYFISSTSAMMRGMSIVVDFIAKYKGAIVTLAASIAAYTVAVNASNVALRLHYTWLIIVEKAQAIAKATVLMCSVAYNKLTGNITRAEAAQKMLNSTMKVNPWGLVLAAVTALGVAIYKAATQTDAFTKSVKEQISAANGASQEYVKEQRELDLLFGKLKGAEKGSDDYKSAKKAIIDQYGKYLSGMIDEKGEIINLTDAYDRLTEAIRRSAKERGIANARQALEDKYTQQTADDLQRLQQSLEKYGVGTAQAAEVVQQVATAMASGKDIPRSALDVIEKASKNMPWYSSWRWGKKNTVQYEGPAGIVNNMYRHQGEYDKGQKTLDTMENGVNPLRKIDAAWLDRAIESLEKLVKSHGYGKALVIVEGTNQAEYKDLTPVQAQALLHKYREEKAYRGGGGSTKSETASPSGSYTPQSTDKSKKSGKTPDKFKAEKEWREYEEALNRIAYAKGVKNYEEYTKRMLEIEEQFYQRQLLHSDITKNERIVIEAQLAEVQRKQIEEKNRFSIEEENKAYEEDKAITQQMYIDKLLTTEAYNKQIEATEIRHLKNVRDIYKNQAEKAITEWEDARRKAAEQMQSSFKGNVDLLNRPVIDAHELTKAGWSGNPTQPGEATATVYSSQYGIKDASGNVHEILVTPILPDGTVLSEKELKDYISKSLEGAEDVLAADDKKLVIAVDVSTDGMAGEDLHKLQEIFYSLKPKVDEKAWNNYLKASASYQDKLVADQTKRQQEYERKTKEHQQKLREVWQNYAVSDKEKKQQYYEQTKALIDEAYQRELNGFAMTAEEKLKVEEAYQRALAKLRKEVFESDSEGASSPKSLEEVLKSVLKDPFKKMKDKNGNPIFDEDDLANLDLVLDQAFASVSSMFDSLNKLWEAEEQMKLAKLEQRYDREISMAEGNAYKIKELEKKKNREQAQIKAESQKRQFAQQVLSAVAQTATAAINAYSSAAAIPVVGHVLAPIAASLAVAAGMMQVAVIKQQQNLSNAQGYSKGGFTPNGPENQPVGIVHAGEWVASQKLLRNPATRPAIEALDFAQRNNTFGSIRQEDVTRHVTAPAVIAQASADGSIERAIFAMSVVMGEYQETMQQLGDRLNKPFVTVNTVTGDRGIKKAQDDYRQLENNTLPKAKRK